MSEIEQNFSEEYILAEYKAGNIPAILAISYCSVCEQIFEWPTFDYFPLELFKAYYSAGIIIKNAKGNLARVMTTYTCEPCKRELAELD